MEAQPQVPPEIVDHILSFLHNDQPSLGRCAQANQAFSELAERRLYQTITLNNFVPDREVDKWKTGKLANVLEGAPRLRSHVQALGIMIAPTELLQQFDNPLTKEERIGEILPLFSQIIVVGLAGKISWNSLHQTFRDAFDRMLGETVSLTHMVIGGITDFPSLVLNHCKSLKHLSLMNMGIYLSDDFTPLNQRPQLKFLNIQDGIEEWDKFVPRLMPWLLTDHPRLENLSCLHIDIPTRHDIDILQSLLLDKCSRTLEEIHLRSSDVVQTHYNSAYETIGTPPPKALNFSKFRSLRSLSIFGNIRMYLDASLEPQDPNLRTLSTFIPWVVELLQTFDTPNILECIGIKATSYIHTKNPNANLSLTKPDWQPLARLLTSRRAFPALCRVETSPLIMISDFPNVLATLHRELSGLVQNGLLPSIKQSIASGTNSTP